MLHYFQTGDLAGVEDFLSLFVSPGAGLFAAPEVEAPRVAAAGIFCARVREDCCCWG